MSATDGHKTRSARTAPPPMATLAVAVALATLAGCHGKHWRHPRPSVEQLMQDAIAENIVHRAEQQAITDAKDAHAAESFSVDQPEKPAAPSGGGPPSAVLLAAGAEALPIPPPKAAPRLNEEFFETDLREALSILAEEAGADILLDDRVRGVVNTTIRDATFDEALDKVLLPLGFVVGKRGEQYIICEPDPESPLFPYISTQVEYRPQHLNAKDLLAAPPTQMKRFVRVIEQANVLVIEAPTQFVGTILERLRSLDQPVPQVELEAIVCVVEPDSGFRFGLDWDHAVQLDGDAVFRAGVSGLAISGQVSGRGIRELFSDFSTTSTFVRLLADNGYLTIRASPRVMAQSGEKANIKIGRESYFAVQPAGGNANSTVFFQQDIKQVLAGIELEITPYVRDNDVTVNITRAEVSEDVRTTATELELNPFPVINRRTVSTTVHVEDGKTIIIGGLVQRETIDRVNRVPGLSRLPGVGYLFKSVEHQDREAEVVIFISPRIVRPADCGPGCDPAADDALRFPPP